MPAFQIPLTLKRFPVLKNELLQAWDAADELLLSHLSTLALQGKKIAILDDHFGALTCGLMEVPGVDLTVYTDSFVAARGIQLNLEEQNLNAITPLKALTDLKGPFDLALICLPKNLSYFEDLLCHLSLALKPGAEVICSYRIKHQANTAFTLLEKIIGKTHTSLAQKKARLIFAPFTQKPTASPYPKEVTLDGFDETFCNYSNVFSREKLDLGTRFFLENLPEEGDFGRILDLGCGNGVLGIATQHLHPHSQMIFSDESFMAIQSAQVNFERARAQSEFKHTAQFLWTHGYEGPDTAGSLDLVLCNPPFHQGMTQGDHIAWQLFQDARKALRVGGKLRIVGNSHLAYGATLRRIFGNVEKVAENAKFQILDVEKL